ncbi:MAG: lipopolysaccharide biosynthesis protein RfbH, partial [Verrucomicrobiia bacterium]
MNKESENIDELKEKILLLTKEYSQKVHKSNLPGENPQHPQLNSSENCKVPYAGRVFTSEEVVAAVSSTLDFWLT